MTIHLQYACAGILSTIFLKRKLQWFKWLGMVLVIGGLVTVGANDLINGNVSLFFAFNFCNPLPSPTGKYTKFSKLTTKLIYVRELLSHA